MRTHLRTKGEKTQHLKELFKDEQKPKQSKNKRPHESMKVTQKSVVMKQITKKQFYYTQAIYHT